jgi:hypothetical protein
MENLENSIWQQPVAKLHWGHKLLIFSKIQGYRKRLSIKRCNFATACGEIETIIQNF